MQYIDSAPSPPTTATRLPLWLMLIAITAVLNTRTSSCRFAVDHLADAASAADVAGGGVGLSGLVAHTNGVARGDGVRMTAALGGGVLIEE